MFNIKEAEAQIADFSYTIKGGCGNAEVRFVDNSGSGVNNWDWSFGNFNILKTSDPSKGKNPSVIYPEAGVYTVKLIINNDPSNVIEKKITIFPNPDPEITIDGTTNFGIKNKGCEPFNLNLGVFLNDVSVKESTKSQGDVTITVGAVSGGLIQSYDWNFMGKIDNISQATPDISLNDINSGDYKVILTVVDERGCRASTSLNSGITVYKSPKVDFNLNKENACGLGNVDFKAEVNGIDPDQIQKYEWDINNDGSIENNSKNYTHNFNSPGLKTIKLSAVSLNSCPSNSVIKTVKFNDDNIIDFDITNACPGEIVNFKNKSSESAVKFKWDFENNGSYDSTTKNASKSYSKKGDYTVKLWAEFDDKCVMTTTKDLSISELKADFNYKDLHTCSPNYKVQFTDNSSSDIGDIDTYYWIFDNKISKTSTEQNPEVSFSYPGEHTASLTITSGGCSRTVTKTINIERRTLSIDEDDKNQFCVPVNVDFTSTYDADFDPIVSYKWKINGKEFSTQANNNHTINERGTHQIQLFATTQNSCIVKSNTIELEYGEEPVIGELMYDEIGCKKFGVDFKIKSSEHTDKLEFNFLNLEVNDKLSFAGHENGETTIYETIANFPKPGLHTVSVVAQDNKCKTTKSFPSITIQEPNAYFSFDEKVCDRNQEVQFKNESSGIIPGTIHTWDFGDGSPISNEESPSHVFGKTGDFTVTYTVEVPVTMCTSTIQKTVHVVEYSPDFVADKTIGCHPDEIEFTQNGSGSSNFIVSKTSWDFEGTDSFEGIKNKMSHIYTKPNKYDVKVRIADIKGCSYEATKSKYMWIKGPLVSFTRDPEESCTGNTVNFKSTSTNHSTDDSDINDFTYEWNFGDGSAKQTGITSSHSYSSEDIYNVTLSVNDGNGCSSTYTEKSAVIIPSMTAKFKTSQNTFCKGDAVSFQNISTIKNGSASITNYMWDLDGDGIYEINTNSAQNQTITYNKIGKINVSLKLISSLGCESDFSKEIEIVTGDAKFHLMDNETNLGCAPALAYFYSDDLAKNVVSYEWDFGNGVTSDLRNPVNAYDIPG
ncbi:MAG: PKD domain-containing protein [Marinifilaceae bacterium]|jgi:PKD repeat protein|nr:PKD domain-containing protein [Marinifilaceae bacterium]